jgi:SAM-dependent methyltransferase
MATPPTAKTKDPMKPSKTRKDAAARKEELATTDWSQYDFIDLGCSRGNSIRHCALRFSAGEGIGVDLNPQRVESSRANGLNAVCGDARALEATDEVRFVSMMDFLEHLPHLKAVRQVIESAAQAATAFLYIFHPSFEDEQYVSEQYGVKQYWWDWRNHAAHMHVDDYCRIFDELGLRNFFIRYVKPVADASHPSVLPGDAPPNQSVYDAATHGPKPTVTFPRPLWRAQEIFVALKPFKAAQWADLTRPWKDTPLGELAVGKE